MEKIAASADIPMLVCGDFNSVPGRSVFSYEIVALAYVGDSISLVWFLCLAISAFHLSCSAPHALLAMGKVDPMHPDLAVDPLTILRPHTKLTHQLPLVI